jgi:DNA-binding NtrC family response regulator
VETFIDRLASKSHKGIRGLSPEALATLRKYPFPGNVRELSNAIEHAFVMCGGEEIGVEHLPEHIVQESRLTAGSLYHEKSEREVILEALERHRGSRGGVARELGMHRTTLWRKMKSYGIPA